MGKTNNIYLPGEETLAKMIGNAWEEFCRKGREAGYEIGDETGDGFVKDAFVWGYVQGYNDLLFTFRGQAEVGDVVSRAFENDEEDNAS